MQVVKPREPGYVDLPSNIFKSVNKLEITTEGLKYIREEFSSGKHIRGIAEKSYTAITLAFQALRDEE